MKVLLYNKSSEFFLDLSKSDLVFILCDKVFVFFSGVCESL